MFHRILTSSLAIVGLALAPGAWAGELDLNSQGQHQDYMMALLALHDQLELQTKLTNLNTFTEALGGAQAPAITRSTDIQHPYEINGEAVSDFTTAIDRTCEVQKHECGELANGAHGGSRGMFSVSDCEMQSSRCRSFLGSSATQTAFLSKVTVDGNDEFDFYCEN